MLGIIYPRDNFPWGQFSSGLFVRGVISREILSGSNYLCSNCPRAIVRGQSIRGQVSSVGGGGGGGNCPGGDFPRGQLSGHR